MSAPAAHNSPAYLAEDIGPTIIATASLMIIFCTVFVGLRYWARYLTSTPWGVEDVIIPFAWLAEIGLCIVGIVMVKKAGTGRHMNFILQTDPGKITEHYKGIMINEILHPAAVAFPKLVVVVLFLRVFTNKYERIAAWTLIGIIFATWFSFTVAACFQCTPFAFNWDKTVPNGRCFNVVAFAYSSSVPNIITDVFVLFLPIRTVMDLKVSIGRRIGLLLIFLTGSAGIIASIIRTVVFATTDPLVDITFTNTSLVNWTIIEPGLYLLSACALSFKPLFRMVAKALHLQGLITHTKSALGKTSNTNRTNLTHKDVHMQTFKSESGGGFAKLADGKDLHTSDDEEEEEVWGLPKELGQKKGASDGRISVVVTRTVEVDSETLQDTPRDVRFNVADQDEKRSVGRAV